MFTRRKFLQTSLLATGTLTGAGPALAQSKTRPNVVFIIADDMNDYGFYGGFPGAKMPYMEAFKKTALTFELAYCGAPVCTPSRAAVFSGRFPHSTGAYRNGCAPWDKAPFNTDESMPECFKRNGYETFGRGKLFHAPLPQAREEAMWDNRPIFTGGFGPFPEEKDQAVNKFFSFKAWEGPDSDFPDIVNADAAIEFLKQPHEKPFFLTYGLWRPHTPFTAPKRFFDIFPIKSIPEHPPGYRAGDQDDVPEMGRELVDIWGRFNKVGPSNKALWREFLRAYCACTAFADWNAGRVLEELDQSPYADNTIVIFWSDNGYHCGEKGHWEKGVLWEQAARTPLLIRVPGASSNGGICRRPVSSVDFYPTLADYCGLDLPKHTLEGLSLRPLIENPQADWKRPALTSYGEGYASVRGGRYRYIRYPDGSEELYDHDQDPHEFENLAGNPEYDAVKQRLGKWIPQQWAKSLGGREG